MSDNQTRDFPVTLAFSRMMQGQTVSILCPNKKAVEWVMDKLKARAGDLAYTIKGHTFQLGGFDGRVVVDAPELSCERGAGCWDTGTGGMMLKPTNMYSPTGGRRRMDFASNTITLHVIWGENTTEQEMAVAADDAQEAMRQIADAIRAGQTGTIDMEA